MTVIHFAMLSLFPALMAYAACSDLLTMRISNRVSLILFFGFVVMGFALRLPLDAWLMHFAAGGLVLVITFALFAAGWVGGGDAKLAAVTAMWLGWTASGLPHRGTW